MFRRLGEVPCLLSEPSTVDLRIAPTDLLSRLQAYQEAGARAAEADLLVALTRLDVSTADDGLRAELEQVHVPVVLWSGRPMAGQTGTQPTMTVMSDRWSSIAWSPALERWTTMAGPAVSRYIADPVVEPAEGESWRGRESVPESLRIFPARLRHKDAVVDLAVFPTWGDAVMQIDGYRFNRDLGLQMRRLALHATPLPPAVVLGFLSARSDPHLAAVDDAARAVTKAWERGLLRPGAPGTRYLDLAAAPRGLAAEEASGGTGAGRGPRTSRSTW